MDPPSTFSSWASFYGNTPFIELLPETAEITLEQACIPYLDERTKIPEQSRWVLHY